MQEGYDVSFVCLHDKAEIRDGVNIIPISRCSGPLTRLRTAYAAAHAALQLQPDLIHFHTPELIPFVPMMQRRVRHIVYDMHENQIVSGDMKVGVSAWNRFFYGHVFRLGEKFILRNSSVIFAENSYAKYYPWVLRHKTVLNMPILQDFIGIERRYATCPTMGYLGSISAHRGSLLLLRALRILLNRGIKVRLEFVGTGSADHMKELDAAVTRLQLSKHIIFHGYQSPQAAYRIIAGWDLGLAVLEPVSNYYESYPTKMFEYMALGIPVIASNFPVNRDVLDNERCGLCVDPCAPEELADAMQSLLTNPAVMREMGDNGITATRKFFNWQTENGKLTSFYSDILARKGQSC